MRKPSKPDRARQTSKSSKKADQVPPRDAFDAIYTCAQTEWALWRFLNGPTTRKQPSNVFKITIKHLLEFDRRDKPLAILLTPTLHPADVENTDAFQRMMYCVSASASARREISGISALMVPTSRNL